MPCLRSLAALRCRLCHSPTSVECATSAVFVSLLSKRSVPRSPLKERIVSLLPSWYHSFICVCQSLEVDTEWLRPRTATFADTSVSAPFDFALSLRAHGSQNASEKRAYVLENLPSFVATCLGARLSFDLLPTLKELRGVSKCSGSQRCVLCNPA